MSKEKPKSGTNDAGGDAPPASGRPGATASKRNAPVANNISGRVKHDDRGNAVWEWAVTTGSFASDSSAQRLKKLDNPTLSLAEDAPSPHGAVQKNPLGTVKGYSPYDSGLLAKGAAPRKKKDLRKLSEWLKLRKQASGNDPNEE